MLFSKGIDYKDLKIVLVPKPDRNEVAFVFDTTKIKSSWYGYEIFEKIIPFFDRRSSHSVFCGDYTGKNKHQDRLYKEFCKEVKPIRSCDYRHSSQFFLVYINNLSDRMVASFEEGLFCYEPFIGWIALNYSSFMKTYLSIILCGTFIKHKNAIIMAHEDDRDNNENINVCCYPFEKNGYLCKSLQSSLYGVFLSYKIEREVYEGFEEDTLFSINAISENVSVIYDFNVMVEESKLQYLFNNKRGKLKKCGMINFGPKELEQMIRKKIRSNYIYNMRYLKEHEKVEFNFNILVETKAPDSGELVKITLGLKYKPSENLLRLITMF